MKPVSNLQLSWGPIKEGYLNGQALRGLILAFYYSA